MVVAVGTGLTSGVDDLPTKVCHHVVQSVFFTEDCNNDFIGRPSRNMRFYTSLVSIPLLSEPNLDAGDAPAERDLDQPPPGRRRAHARSG